MLQLTPSFIVVNLIFINYRSKNLTCLLYFIYISITNSFKFTKFLFKQIRIY
nr:MAG TPA: hypothetical protein [Crassvirales sp.]